MPWLYGEPMNKRPFQHYADGFEFFTERCDIRGAMYVVKPDFRELTEQDFMKATAQVMGYHACNIHKELNGFSGYGNITFEFVTEEKAKELKAQFGLNN